MISSLYEKRKPLILVADDSAFARYQVTTFLEAEGYDSEQAKDGIEAVSKFSEIKPDVVLLDYVMPGADGPTACKMMMESPEWNNASIFMITSMTDQESVNKAYSAGAMDYISKPVNFAVLRQRLKSAVESREAMKELKHSSAFSQSIINYAVEGIITIDRDKKIRYINPSAAMLFKLSEDRLVGSDIGLVIPNLNIDENEGYLEMQDRLIGDACEVEGVDSAGGVIPLEATISRFWVEDKCYFTLIIRDITERKIYEERIKMQAFYDALTGLPNRVLLRERMSYEITRAKRNETKFALMYLDLDRFKIVNDTLGHDRGDKLLNLIAERLQGTVRAEDLVVRMGGDEFVIMLTDLHNVEYIGKIANKILEAIKHPIDLDGNAVNLTTSIGVTIFPDDGRDYETLLINADVAMYRAKEKGKNNFETFTAELNAKAIERLELENSLRRAIEYNEFVLHYQPKISAKTSKIVGMEALVRWQHPKLGLLSPIKFIPLAEETGLIVPIGEWVLRTACAQNKSLQNAGMPPISVSVNLSMRQFELQNLVEKVADILAETGLDPEHLELEITESIAMKNVGHTVGMIKDIQKLGVKFSIDDFGTGYSSLSQINNLAVNKLKIDKSFIHMIDGEKENSVIASTVMALGKNLNMQVVAEGVENEAQLEFLVASDCDEMQGYFIGKPMPCDEFKAMYRDSLSASEKAPDTLNFEQTI